MSNQKGAVLTIDGVVQKPLIVDNKNKLYHTNTCPIFSGKKKIYKGGAGKKKYNACSVCKPVF